MKTYALAPGEHNPESYPEEEKEEEKFDQIFYDLLKLL